MCWIRFKNFWKSGLTICLRHINFKHKKIVGNILEQKKKIVLHKKVNYTTFVRAWYLNWGQNIKYMTNFQKIVLDKQLSLSQFMA